MQPDDKTPSSPSAQASPQAQHNARPSAFAALWQTPAPLKRLFDHFPLYTYPSNPLPIAPHDTKIRLSSTNTLYVFGPPNQPSLNPGCLRYQALLVLAGIPFETATSNNHASPTGALPFLVTARDNESNSSKTIPSPALKQWLSSQEPANKVELDANPVHLALLEPIRRAYLAALYLDDATIAEICAPMYVDTASRSRIVRAALVPPLRMAAAEEVRAVENKMPENSSWEMLRRWWAREKDVDEESLYEGAQDAFAALSTVLGEQRWFGAGSGGHVDGEVPGWLDASVFSYTHVILTLFGGSGPGGEKGMKRRKPLGVERLYRAVMRQRNLIEHRDRILKAFGEAGFA